MTWQETIRGWVDWARQNILDREDYPLIDSHELDMTDALVEVSSPYYDPSELESAREAAEDALAPDPGDIAVRCVALNFFYQLAYGPMIEKEELEEVAAFCAACKKHLAQLVRLRDVADCTDLRTVRWEIVNACAIQDWDRALALFGQMKDHIPAHEYHALKGVFLFQSVFLVKEPADLIVWVPTITPQTDALLLALWAMDPRPGREANRSRDRPAPGCCCGV